MSLSGLPGSVIIANRSTGGSLEPQAVFILVVGAAYAGLAPGIYVVYYLPSTGSTSKSMLRAMVWMAEMRVYLIALACFLPAGAYTTVSLSD